MHTQQQEILACLRLSVLALLPAEAKLCLLAGMI
jgi:hypothetical protein